VSPWIHSFASGLTLRAGGFPQDFCFFAWGGNEGTHTIANLNTSLLGGSGRHLCIKISTHEQPQDHKTLSLLFTRQKWLAGIS